jgi:hypothetical protein
MQRARLVNVWDAVHAGFAQNDGGVYVPAWFPPIALSPALADMSYPSLLAHMLGNWGRANASSSVLKASSSKESDTSARARTDSVDEGHEASQSSDDADMPGGGGDQGKQSAEREDKQNGASSLIGREELLEVIQRSLDGCEFGDVTADESNKVTSCTIKVVAWMRPLIAILGHLRARAGEILYTYVS